MERKISTRRILSIILHSLIDIILIGGIYILVAIGSFRNVSLASEQIIHLIVFGAVIIIATEIVFWIFKIYMILTENFGILESLKMMAIILSIFIVFYVAMIITPNNLLPNFHIELFLLATASVIFLLPATRYFKRVSLFIRANFKKQNKTIRTLVIGAGAAAKIIIEEARNNPKSKNDIVIIVDDDKNKIGGVFSDLPVTGPIKNVKKIIEKYEIEEVIIGIATLNEEKLKEIIAILDTSNVKIKRFPLLSEMQDVHSINIIDINLDNLLGREIVRLDNKHLTEMLTDATVLITGAGGSIGSELALQIFEARPKLLVLFDIYENGVYGVQQEILIKKRQNPAIKTEIVVLIGSIYNDLRLEQIFKKYRPDFVYHAAAYKHVPLMEDSPQEAIRTNVLGTYNLAKLSDLYGIKKMILISTDKAVRPTNVMGATKRFAEMIVQHFSSISQSTSYACVRFGNVLGSSGSVVPLFLKQIENGGPVTVTDPEITRFFMTIPEATSLILQCSIYAKKSEVFILDMGEPVKILNLAEKMIRQAGFMPYREIDIKFTGLRPGEKLYEEILIDVSKHKKTANSKIYIEEQETDFPIDEYMKTIANVFTLEENKEIKNVLATIVTTYHRTNKD